MDVWLRDGGAVIKGFGVEGARRRDSQVWRSTWRLGKLVNGCYERDKREAMSIYRAICCSRSSIFARFKMFLGFGLGVLGGGVESLCKAVSTRSVCLSRTSEGEAIARTLLNQSDISDFVEKSFNNCC